jgi:hypothetical protein
MKTDENPAMYNEANATKMYNIGLIVAGKRINKKVSPKKITETVTIGVIPSEMANLNANGPLAKRNM